MANAQLKSPVGQRSPRHSESEEVSNSDTSASDSDSPAEAGGSPNTRHSPAEAGGSPNNIRDSTAVAGRRYNRVGGSVDPPNARDSLSLVDGTEDDMRRQWSADNRGGTKHNNEQVTRKRKRKRATSSSSSSSSSSSGSSSSSSSSDSESDDENLNFGQLQDVSKKPHIPSKVVKYITRYTSRGISKKEAPIYLQTVANSIV